MKICLPVDRAQGLDSEIAPNFRAAPALLVVDSLSGETAVIDTAAGTCGATPRDIDAIVFAGGMGRGMFNGFRSRGIRVFSTDALTVAEALAELGAGRLQAVEDVACCGGGNHHHHHHPHGAQTEHAHGGCGCGEGKHDGSEAKGGCGCAGH